MFPKELNKIVGDFIKFKSNMGLKLSLKKAKSIWGKEVLQISNSKYLEKGTKDIESEYVFSKLKIAKEHIKDLLVNDWVQFIGISGSIAAGFAKEDDDIDILIVVRDDCAWIYRGILKLRNLKSHFIRSKNDGENVKDLLCINFISEERGLQLESDIFNLHELMYLIPIYYKRYLRYIYKRNDWLKNDYYVQQSNFEQKDLSVKKVNSFIRILNILAYISQVFFMIISGHRPEIKRILHNYKNGRIEFFPSDYKKEILKKLK